ncbi:MAG: hypothetical protein ACQKBY_04215 [Verrucomicrobiales bacterium]
MIRRLSALFLLLLFTPGVLSRGVALDFCLCQERFVSRVSDHCCPSEPQPVEQASFDSCGDCYITLSSEAEPFPAQKDAPRLSPPATVHTAPAWQANARTLIPAHHFPPLDARRPPPQRPFFLTHDAWLI